MGMPQRMYLAFFILISTSIRSDLQQVFLKRGC